MATAHMFKADLAYLEDNPLTGNYKILVVGTFNAAISGNSAQWFYGRPENEFWCLLPRMLGFETLHPVDRNEKENQLAELWKGFCKKNEIIIVDLFKEVKENLTNHADSNLQKLKKEEYLRFEFEKAFINCHFDYVMFTWKGTNKNTLTDLKNDYINFFSKKGSKIVQLLTPSNAYSKPRNFKLKQWKEAYAK